jgi:hypothetical protein
MSKQEVDALEPVITRRPAPSNNVQQSTSAESKRKPDADALPSDSTRPTKKKKNKFTIQVK